MLSGTISKFFSYLKNVIILSSMGTGGFSAGVKRSERDADHTLPSSAMVLCAFLACNGTAYTFTLFKNVARV